MEWIIVSPGDRKKRGGTEEGKAETNLKRKRDQRRRNREGECQSCIFPLNVIHSNLAERKKRGGGKLHEGSSRFPLIVQSSISVSPVKKKGRQRLLHRIREQEKMMMAQSTTAKT
jgi:hypothetical protein